MGLGEVGEGQREGPTGVTVVGVRLQVALGEGEVFLRDDLVEGVVRSAEVFAGAAVAVVVQSS